MRCIVVALAALLTTVAPTSASAQAPKGKLVLYTSQPERDATQTTAAFKNAYPGVDVEVLPWAEETEVVDISAFDVGVMPLEDSPWERGKCGYKLIQYMACGLPVVASPVGVNSSIVSDGENGILAKSSGEWLKALELLLSEPDLRRTLGQAGRRKVEEEFCIQVTAPRLASLLRQVGAQ